MSEFEQDIFWRKFKTLRFDLEKIQQKEFNELCDKHRINGSIASSSFLKLRAEVKEKHLKDYLDIIIQSMLGSFSEKNIINDAQRKNLENMLVSHSNSLIKEYKNGLQSAMYSYGHSYSSIIVKESVKSFESMLNQVKYNAQDLLFLAIETHNKNVNLSKSSKFGLFWDKYIKQIVLGIIISVIGGIILSLFI